MRLYIKNKLVTLGGSSVVVDEQDRTVFEIEGKVFSPLRKKVVWMRAVDGRVRSYYVRNKFWHFIQKSSLVYHVGGEKMGQMKDKFFGNCEFVGNYGYSAQGNILKGVKVYKDGELLGVFSREYNSALLLALDTYVLDVYDNNYASFLVALVIAYDNIWDDKKDIF